VAAEYKAGDSDLKLEVLLLDSIVQYVILSGQCGRVRLLLNSGRG